jgi:hypothetical protein
MESELLREMTSHLAAIRTGVYIFLGSWFVVVAIWMFRSKK